MYTSDLTKSAAAILGAAPTAPTTIRINSDDPNGIEAPSFLYIIHFVEKLSHAQHYLGSSVELLDRLDAHAKGRAARITQVLWEAEADWTLAALYVPRPTSVKTIRELESLAKRRHGSKWYCPLCFPGNNIAPTGTMQYPIPFPVTAASLRQGG